MKVLVTGGLGFVAVHVVRRLLDDDHDVTVVDRDGPTSDHQSFLAGGAGRLTLIRADLADPSSRCLEDLDRPDAVVHAAAMTPLAPGVELDSTPAAVAVNVLATARLLAVARAWQVQRMLHISSGSVYGRPVVDAIDESCPPAPQHVYGITKAAADLLVQRHAELGACDAVVARLSQPYGPMERATGSRTALSPVHDWIAAALAGRPLAVDPLGLDRGRDYLYVGDVADALVRLLLAPRLGHRIYNVLCKLFYFIDYKVRSFIRGKCNSYYRLIRPHFCRKIGKGLPACVGSYNLSAAIERWIIRILLWRYRRKAGITDPVYADLYIAEIVFGIGIYLFIDRHVRSVRGTRSEGSHQTCS